MIENAETIQQTENPTPIKRKRGRPPKVSKSTLPTDKVEAPKTNKNVPKSNEAQLSALLRTTGAKYDTLDMDVYKARLDNMSLNDLRDEAIRVNIKPLGDRSLTTITLIGLFREEVLKFTPNISGIDKTPKLDPDKRARLTELMKNARN